jgi:hypothetical protein
VLAQANAYAMIRLQAAAAGIATKPGNHSFRAPGMTSYLKNGGGTLEKAAAMADRTSTRTTQLYDRRRDEVSLDTVERIPTQEAVTPPDPGSVTCPCKIQGAPSGGYLWL